MTLNNSGQLPDLNRTFSNAKILKERKRAFMNNISKKVICFSACLLFGFSANSGNSFSQIPPIPNRSLKKGRIQDQEEVISYKDVLGCYYNLVATKTNNITKSYVEFENDYYSSDNTKTLYRYTYDFGLNNGITLTDLKEDENEIMPLSSYSSSPVDYILTSSDSIYTSKAEFQRAPYKSIYDYSAVQAGDIVYETETILFNSGHNALITNMNHQGYYSNYIQTVEAVSPHVSYGFLDDLRMTSYKVKILRVSNSTTDMHNAAINFAKQQLGKSYSLSTVRLNTSIKSQQWYCSELVYASYKYAGIDIGATYDSDGNIKYLEYGCMPSDIYNSFNTYSVYMPYFGPLNLYISDKVNNTWWIEVYNPCSTTITVEYNQKMCKASDAKEWINLKDLKTQTICAHDFCYVKITENWFATSIVASYIKGNYRFVTFADNLNINTKILSQHVNIKGK